jgi:hypothetical protein
VRAKRKYSVSSLVKEWQIKDLSSCSYCNDEDDDDMLMDGRGAMITGFDCWQTIFQICQKTIKILTRFTSFEQANE